MKYITANNIEPLAPITTGIPETPTGISGQSVVNVTPTCNCNLADPDCSQCSGVPVSGFNLPSLSCCVDERVNFSITATMWRTVTSVPCCDGGLECSGCPGFREEISVSGTRFGGLTGTITTSIISPGCAPGYPYTFPYSFDALNCSPWVSFGIADSLNYLGVEEWPVIVSRAATSTCGQFTCFWTARTTPAGGTCAEGSGSDYVQTTAYVNIVVSGHEGICCIES
jgi:hypothetical protein